MKRYIIVFLFTLAACAAPESYPKIHWFIYENTDEFTDVKTCRVTVGSIYTYSSIYTEPVKLYPFIEIVDGELHVGVMSGGRIKIPVGNIQLRIDDNKMWIINITETPLNYIPHQPSPRATHAGIAPAHIILNPEQAAAKKAMDAARHRIAVAMSPYTATTGEKAWKILNEMLKGKILKYRSISGNIQGTTGVYALDESFHTALKKCGITP